MRWTNDPSCSVIEIFRLISCSSGRLAREVCTQYSRKRGELSCVERQQGKERHEQTSVRWQLRQVRMTMFNVNTSTQRNRGKLFISFMHRSQTQTWRGGRNMREADILDRGARERIAWWIFIFQSAMEKSKQKKKKCIQLMKHNKYRRNASAI